jgi:uncharacterized protein YkwD
VDPKLAVERLEVRDCPASVNFFNGILTVTGTSGNDTITVSLVNGRIVAEGRSFNPAAVTSIVVTAGAGDDVIHDRTGRDSLLYGGLGNDTIYGYAGHDKIWGGAGNDRLYGVGGNDTIWGGGGSDTVDGGVGTNTLHQGSPVRTTGNSAIEAEIIRLVNVERARAGLPALRVNSGLNYAAFQHTKDMVAIGNRYGAGQGMQHILYGTLRSEITDRLDVGGYDTWTRSYAYGENIAYGYTSAAHVMQGWMNSPGHRANILSANFSEIGVSVQADSAGRLYFTQNFGRQT